MKSVESIAVIDNNLKKRKNYTAVSLFTGAGGMDIGFEKAGIIPKVAVELMKEAANTYSINHPKTKVINDDINNVIRTFDKYKGVDFVFGGPPCQGFSVAGKMDPDDERSKLVFTFLDAVEKIQPKVFVMENVKALGTLSKWSDVRKKYFEQAKNMGYNCVSFVLKATDYGVPQKRERVFFIGIKGNDDELFESNFQELLKKQQIKAPSVREVLKDLGKAGSERNPNTCTSKITFATRPVMRKSPYSGMYSNGQGRPIDVDNYSNTLPASMGGNKTPFVDEEYLYGDSKEDWVVGYHKGLMEGKITPSFEEAPTRLRRITINEAARIQTFPNGYKFFGSKGKIYTQIGNAVPSRLAEAVAKTVVSYLEKFL